NPAQWLRALKGHSGTVDQLDFSRGGDLLLSVCGDDVTSRLWDPMTGNELLNVPGTLPCLFGPDDRGLIHGWQVATGRRRRTFPGRKGLLWVALSPGGRLVASGSRDGVQLWDVAAAREGDKEVATLYGACGLRCRFDLQGESLITDGGAGLQRWPITPDPETG